MSLLDRLYLIVDESLPAGLKASQAAHALTEMSLSYREETQRWRDGKNIVVILKAALTTLEWLLAFHKTGEIVVGFTDLDLGPNLTAIAVFTEHSMLRNVIRKLPLAF